MTKAKQPVHLESARVGVRLALLAMQGNVPPQDVVTGLLNTGREQIDFIDFPVEMLVAGNQTRLDRRRQYAMKGLECLLIKSTDPALMSADDLRALVSRAWTLAAAMEEQDNVSQQIETAATAMKKG